MLDVIPMTLEADGLPLTMLGVAAGILILTGWVKQIYKGYTSKSLKDVSKFLMIFISAGAVLWLVYGIVVWDVFIIGTNIAAIVLMMMVLYMKHRYDGLIHERHPGAGIVDGKRQGKVSDVNVCPSCLKTLHASSDKRQGKVSHVNEDKGSP